MSVRLMVDDLTAFRKLVPEVIATGIQTIDGVIVMQWLEPLTMGAPAALVIEAFACALPETYITAMASSAIEPVWINLEYLSAEYWVADHHLMPSPHPVFPLTKYYFFPGFTDKTGGLIREAALPEVAQAMDHLDDTAKLRVLVFAYASAPTDALLVAMEKMQSQRESQVTLFDDALSDKHQHWRGSQAENALQAAPVLEIEFIPFVPQAIFDDLLREHDVLFVRGEDSLVRALWAGKPFVWQVYRQTDNAHLAKLEAFLDLYCVGLTVEAEAALRELWRVWNAPDAAAIGPAWKAFCTQLDALRRHAMVWSNRLFSLPDLASNLLSFYQKTSKIEGFAALDI